MIHEKNADICKNITKDIDDTLDEQYNIHEKNADIRKNIMR